MPASSIMWVMADQAHVRVYEQSGPGCPLTRVDEFEQPEGALPPRMHLERMGELLPGMCRTRPREVDPREEAARWFAAAVGRYIEHARARGDFRELALVVHPGMMGLIWSQLSLETARRIRLSLGEDWLHLSEEALMERLSRAQPRREQSACA